MAIWTRVDVDVDAELALALFQLAEVVEVSSFFIPMMIEEGKGGWPKQKLHLLPLLLLLLLLPPLGSISSPNSTSSSLPPPAPPPHNPRPRPLLNTTKLTQHYSTTPIRILFEFF